jgi:tetratricopeptide (TPR) repeat protein
VDARSELARLQLSSGRFQEADSLVQSVMQAGPANARAHGILGEKWALSHDYPKVIAEFQKMGELEPRRAENYGALGAACCATGRNAEAEAAYRKAIEVNLKSVGAHVPLGQFYFSLGKPDKAEAALRSGCGLDVRAEPRRFCLATLDAFTGRLSERGHVTLKEAALDDPQAYSALGGFYLSVGRRKDAVAEFRSLLTAHPKDNSIKAFLVITLLDLNHAEEAASLNRQMLAANAMEPRALLVEGRILTASRGYTEAAEALEKRVPVSTHPADPFSLLEVAQHSAGLADSARPSFTRALQLRPQMAVAATALSALPGDASQPTELAERARRAAPSAAARYLAKANALLAKGDAPQSEAALREALKRDPGSLPVQRLLLNLEIQRRRARGTIQRITMLAAQYPRECRLPPTAGIGLVQPEGLGSIRSCCQTIVAARPRNSQRGNITCQHRVGARFGPPSQGALARGIAANPRGRLNYMVLEYEKEGNWEEAKKICEKAHLINPVSPLIPAELAFLYLEHGGNVNAAVSVAQMVWQKNAGLPCHCRRPRLGGRSAKRSPLLPFPNAARGPCGLVTLSFQSSLE